MQKPVTKNISANISAASSAATASAAASVPSLADQLKEHRPFALRVAYSIVKNRADAEDAVAESCYRALRFAHTYDPKKPFERWFKHIVTMVCYEWLRASKAQKRPQTTPFSQLALHGRGNEGEGFHPALDAPDPRADVAGEALRRVAASFVGIMEGEGIGEAGDLPEWLLDGLLSVSEPDRVLLLDVYVRQIPRKEAACALGVNDYQFDRRLRRAQASLRAVCGLPSGAA